MGQLPKLPFSRLCILLIVLSQHASAQKAPAPETLVLSLKTVGKALAGCREVYTRVQLGATSPLLKLVVGADGYDKDMTSLSQAEKFTAFLIEHPEQIKGRVLVAILSTADDFSVGVGSTRAEILASLVRKDSTVTPQMAEDLLTTSINLAACQKSLFNAGDDYVGLVMQYVDAEDRLVAAPKSR
jgi:hypothetical protein